MSQRLTVFLALALVLGSCANLALAEKREAPLTGTCLTDSDAAITNSSSFSTLRADYVEYNKLKRYVTGTVRQMWSHSRMGLGHCLQYVFLDSYTLFDTFFVKFLQLLPFSQHSGNLHAYPTRTYQPSGLC